MDFHQSLTTLKLRQLAATEESEALQYLLAEIARYRKALQYYAEPQNYLDGSPMLDAFSRDDNGLTAQLALRQIDLVGEPLVVVGEIPNENEAGSNSAA